LPSRLPLPTSAVPRLTAGFAGEAAASLAWVSRREGDQTLATIGVPGGHRSLPLSRPFAHANPRSDVRRVWLAPLLALLAIGLLPVLGRSLVWLGTAATDTPTSTSATPTAAPARA